MFFFSFSFPFTLLTFGYNHHVEEKRGVIDYCDWLLWKIPLSKHSLSRLFLLLICFLFLIFFNFLLVAVIVLVTTINILDVEFPFQFLCYCCWNCWFYVEIQAQPLNLCKKLSASIDKLRKRWQLKKHQTKKQMKVHAYLCQPPWGARKQNPY